MIQGEFSLNEMSKYMELVESGKLQVTYHIQNVSLNLSTNKSVGLIGLLGVTLFVFGVTGANIAFASGVAGMYCIFWAASIAGENKKDGKSSAKSN